MPDARKPPKQQPPPPPSLPTGTVAVAAPVVPAAAAGTMVTGAAAKAATAVIVKAVAASWGPDADIAAWLPGELRQRYPTRSTAWVDELVRQEQARELVFRQRVFARLRRDLPAALALPDARARRDAVRAILDRERSIQRARQEAIVERAQGRADVELLRPLSPEGAYWKLSPYVREHTLDCLALGEKFWPWPVLDTLHPPLHHGCACSLLGLDEAVDDGLMTVNDVRDPREAIAAGRRIAANLRDVYESVAPEDVHEHLRSLGLREGAWSELLHPRDRLGRWADALADRTLGPDQRLGVTPYLAALNADAPRSSFRHARRNFREWHPLFEDFERDADKLSRGYRVRLTHRRRAVGLWKGEFEPSYEIVARGQPDRVRAFDRALGALYGQEAVVAFMPGEGGDAEARLEGDPDRIAAELRRAGIEGATLDENGASVFIGGDDPAMEHRVADAAARAGGRARTHKGEGYYAQLRETDAQVAEVAHLIRVRLHRSNPGDRHALLREGYDARWPKGTVKAGQFRPRRGGSPGARTRRLLRDLVPRPPRAPSLRRRPQQHVLHVAKAELDRQRKAAEQRARDALKSLDPARPPVSADEGAGAAAALLAAGFRVAHDRAGRPGFFDAPTGSWVYLTERNGGGLDVEWRPGARAKPVSEAPGGMPNTVGELFQDLTAFGARVARRHGARQFLAGYSWNPDGFDHSGSNDWTGHVWLGHDVAGDVATDAEARRRGITDDLALRGVWATYKIGMHETSHTINPIDPADYATPLGQALEEGLAEEEGQLLAAERLRELGRGDVLDWLRRNPDDVKAVGVYENYRAGLRDLLDRAGVPAADRGAVVERLKLDTPPAARPAALAELLRRGGWADADERDVERLVLGGDGTGLRSIVRASLGLEGEQPSHGMRAVVDGQEGRWIWLKSNWQFVPKDGDWTRSVPGPDGLVTFESPFGTTDVFYRDKGHPENRLASQFGKTPKHPFLVRPGRKRARKKADAKDETAARQHVPRWAERLAKEAEGRPLGEADALMREAGFSGIGSAVWRHHEAGIEMHGRVRADGTVAGLEAIGEEVAPKDPAEGTAWWHAERSIGEQYRASSARLFAAGYALQGGDQWKRFTSAFSQKSVVLRVSPGGEVLAVRVEDPLPGQLQAARVAAMSRDPHAALGDARLGLDRWRNADELLKLVGPGGGWRVGSELHGSKVSYQGRRVVGDTIVDLRHPDFPPTRVVLFQGEVKRVGRPDPNAENNVIDDATYDRLTDPRYDPADEAARSLEGLKRADAEARLKQLGYRPLTRGIGYGTREPQVWRDWSDGNTVVVTHRNRPGRGYVVVAAEGRRGVSDPIAEPGPKGGAQEAGYLALGRRGGQLEELMGERGLYLVFQDMGDANGNSRHQLYSDEKGEHGLALTLDRQLLPGQSAWDQDAYVVREAREDVPAAPFAAQARGLAFRRDPLRHLGPGLTPKGLRDLARGSGISAIGVDPELRAPAGSPPGWVTYVTLDRYSSPHASFVVGFGRDGRYVGAGYRDLDADNPTLTVTAARQAEQYAERKRAEDERMRLDRERLDAAWRAARARMGMGKPPLEAGDGDAALTVRALVTRGGWRIFGRRTLKGGDASYTLSGPNGERMILHGRVDQAAVRSFPHQGTMQVTKVARYERGHQQARERRHSPPTSMAEFEAAVLGRADELAERYGTTTSANRVVWDPVGQGATAGEMGWDGTMTLYPAVRALLRGPFAAAREGRPLMEGEKRDAFEAYRIVQHEAIHSVRSLRPAEYRPGAGAALEEGLTEEATNLLGYEWLRDMGLGEVADWGRLHQDSVEARGTYQRYRAALDELFADAGIQDRAERRRIVLDARFGPRGGSTDGRVRTLATMFEDPPSAKRLADVRARMEAATTFRSGPVFNFHPVADPDFSGWPEPLIGRLKDGTEVRIGSRVVWQGHPATVVGAHSALSSDFGAYLVATAEVRLDGGGGRTGLTHVVPLGELRSHEDHSRQDRLMGMTREQLRDRAKRYRVSVSGTKAQLVDRIAGMERAMEANPDGPQPEASPGEGAAAGSSLGWFPGMGQGSGWLLPDGRVVTWPTFQGGLREHGTLDLDAFERRGEAKFSDRPAAEGVADAVGRGWVALAIEPDGTVHGAYVDPGEPGLTPEQYRQLRVVSGEFRAPRMSPGEQTAIRPDRRPLAGFLGQDPGPVDQALWDKPPWRMTLAEFARAPNTWWHGTTYGTIGAGPNPVHVGNWATAREALGARAYGQYPNGLLPLPQAPDAAMVPVRIVGPMAYGLRHDFVGDHRASEGPSAEGMLKGMMKRGQEPRQGYYYKNEGEGIVVDEKGLHYPRSAVVPDASWLRTHEQLVREALGRGDPVPAEVLRDYPGLGKASLPSARDARATLDGLRLPAGAHTEVDEGDSDSWDANGGEGTRTVEGRVVGPGGEHIGTFRRRFLVDPDGRLAVSHEVMALDSAWQHKGIGFALNRQAEDGYRRLGVAREHVQTDEVGGYAWARAGFDFDADGSILETHGPEGLARPDVENLREWTRAAFARDILESKDPETYYGNGDWALSRQQLDELRPYFFAGGDYDPSVNYGDGDFVKHPWEVFAIPEVIDDPSLGKRLLLGSVWYGVRDVPAAPAKASPGEDAGAALAREDRSPVPYSPEVATIRGAESANRYLGTLGMEGRLTDVASPATLRQVAQATHDALERFPSLGQREKHLAGVAAWSRMPHDPYLDPQMEGGYESGDIWGMTGPDLRKDKGSAIASFDQAHEAEPDLPGGAGNEQWITLNDTSAAVPFIDKVYTEGDGPGTSAATSTPYGRMMHELGHAVAWSSGLDLEKRGGYGVSGAAASFMDDADLGPREMFELSPYGSSGALEAWAEAFATLNVPHPDWMPPVSDELMKKLYDLREMANAEEGPVL